MEAFEATITKAVEDGTGAGVAAIAVDEHGKTLHAKSFGLTSTDPGYTGMQPLLTQFWAYRGNPPDVANTTVAHSYTLPLLYPPGQGWSYGCSVDWAGRMVERVNGDIRLGEYMKKHIFEVLGMTSTTFRPTLHPEILKRACAKAWQNAEAGILEPDTTGIYPLTADPGDDYGGNGLYSSAEYYIKVLSSFLRNNRKLLRPETRDLLLHPVSNRKRKRR